MSTIAIILIVLIIIGMPIGFVLGISGFTWFYISSQSLTTMVSRIYSGIDSFIFLAIPFFILAGQIMNKAGLTDNLVKFVNVIFGRFRGSLAQANIFASLLFAGLTGAAISDVSAIGSIFIPSMKKQGYSAAFAGAITATSSIVGPIIPPSIVIVMYGGITGVSVGTLFAAAIIPGIIMGLGQSVLVVFIAKKRNFPKFDIKISFKEFLWITKDAILALIMPIIILGGILLGIFTPTESAAVAVFYALFIGIVVYRNIGLRDLYDTLASTVRVSGMLFFIISMANLLSWIITRMRIPTILSNTLLEITGDSPNLAMLLVLIFFLFVGTWMETGAATVLLAPIFAPVMGGLGFHPVHFGIVMCIALNIALVTPPLGVCLFAASGIAEVEFEKIAKAGAPFILLLIITLFLLAFIPELTLFIPRMLGMII